MSVNLVIICASTLLIAVVGGAICFYIDKKEGQTV